MKQNMYYNFEQLSTSVLEALEKTDLMKINNILASVTDPTLVSGVGGSYVVSNFMSKVLGAKNNIICENTTPRDFIIYE